MADDMQRDILLGIIFLENEKKMVICRLGHCCL